MLFAVQMVLTLVFILMLISGEIHKPAALLLCFPLLMSRVGRGAIIMMIALPVTNFLDAVTAVIAIIGTAVGVLNISIGYNDGPVELKFAEEGVPDEPIGGAGVRTDPPVGGQATVPPRPNQKQYEMTQLP